MFTMAVLFVVFLFFVQFTTEINQLQYIDQPVLKNLLLITLIELYAVFQNTRNIKCFHFL